MAARTDTVTVYSILSLLHGRRFEPFLAVTAQPTPQAPPPLHEAVAAFKDSLTWQLEQATELLAGVQLATQSVLSLTFPKTATLAFPVTRSQARQPPASSSEARQSSGAQDGDQEQPDSNAQNGNAPADHESQDGDHDENGSEANSHSGSGSEGEDAPESTPPPSRSAAKYKLLSLKYLEKLKKAVHSYGATAPFTLALLESLSDQELVPDWFQLARAALTGGDFLLWKSEYEENSKNFAARNIRKADSKDWTLKRFLGQKPYQTNQKQDQFSSGLLAQVQTAALKAWKKLPQKGATTSSLANVRQGAEEPCPEFLSRLQSTAERLFGDSESESDFIKHLAFENANAACQAAILPFRNTDLSNYIKLCANIGPTQTLGLAIGAAFQDLKKSLDSPPMCFTCKQPGHFAKHCPNKTASRPVAPPLSNNKVKHPSSICPRGRKGFHWASECRSQTDINNQPLKPRWQGNYQWGQPQAPAKTNPGAMRFVQPSPPTIPALPSIHHAAAVSPTYGWQQQGAQEWTSVPPPRQY
ncbi:endogenous retrovirus group K member 10 Gag polyprotein-like [Dasypus novemcinctus]|uniref:endogenous retrovirus group K member 10 Gag polyprotein-like n=1 Tax=Dasypus novemcinctus TaxID=9361 RepID=UPI0039C9A15B